LHDGAAFGGIGWPILPGVVKNFVRILSNNIFGFVAQDFPGGPVHEEHNAVSVRDVNTFGHRLKQSFLVFSRIQPAGFVVFFRFFKPVEHIFSPFRDF
jgi:hypothetical protein